MCCWTHLLVGLFNHLQWWFIFFLHFDKYFEKKKMCCSYVMVDAVFKNQDLGKLLSESGLFALQILTIFSKNNPWLINHASHIRVQLAPSKLTSLLQFSGTILAWYVEYHCRSKCNPFKVSGNISIDVIFLQAKSYCCYTENTSLYL